MRKYDQNGRESNMMYYRRKPPKYFGGGVGVRSIPKIRM